MSNLYPVSLVFKSVLAIAVFVSLVAGCSKKEEEPKPLKLAIEGLRDFTMKRTDTLRIPLRIRTMEGSTDSIRLRLSTGQLGGYLSADRGKADFTPTLTLFAQPGEPFPERDTVSNLITIEAFGDRSLGAKSWFRVACAPECIYAYTPGIWTGNRGLMYPSGPAFQSRIYVDSDRNLLRVTNFGNFGEPVELTCVVDCRKDLLDIPEQRFGDTLFISGMLNAIWRSSELRFFTRVRRSSGQMDSFTVFYRQ